MTEKNETPSPVPHVEAALAAERERCAAIADTFTCGLCGMDGKAGEAIRQLSPAAPVQHLRGDPKPFMYGIMCPDGTAYLDEICVDSNDSQTLIDVIEEQELEGHKVVPLYVHPPSPAQYLEEEYDADIALFDKAIASAEARLCITNADLPLIINALGYAERSNVRGAGELRDKLKARLEGC